MKSNDTKSVLFLFFLIFLTILWKINYGYEEGDSFFSLNQFLFFDEAPHCVNIPLFLTSYFGSCLVKLAGWLSIGPALFLRMVTACIRMLAAVVIYRTMARDIGKYPVLLGLLLGFMLEKSSFFLFYYSFVSLYGFVFMLCTLLAAIKNNNKVYYFISGLIYAVCIFCRCSNVVYGAAYLLVLLYDDVSWKVSMKRSCRYLLYALGGLACGSFCVFYIINSRFGLSEYSRILENVKASSVDGHGGFSLIFREICLLVQGGILLIGVTCLAAVYSLFLRKREFGRMPYLLLIGLGSIFFMYLWIDPFVVNFFTYSRLCYLIFLFIIMAAAFLLLVCGSWAVRENSGFTLQQKRLVAAVSVFMLVGHFGSLSSLGLYVNCMAFIMPALFFLWLKSDSLIKLPLQWRFCESWQHMWLFCWGGLTAIALFFASTFTIGEMNRPKPGKSMREYRKSSQIPILAGIKLTSREKQYYERLLHELSGYTNSNELLISLGSPADNAILGMAPFLKWQGGWTWLTYPGDMKKQLHAAKDCPYILIPKGYAKQYAHREEQKEVLLAYVAEHDYKMVETRHYRFYIPKH